MYATNKGDDRFMRVQNSKDCNFTHNRFITTNLNTPESILLIDDDAENITDVENVSESFN